MYVTTNMSLKACEWPAIAGLEVIIVISGHLLMAISSCLAPLLWFHSRLHMTRLYLQYFIIIANLIITLVLNHYNSLITSLRYYVFDCGYLLYVSHNYR